MKALLIYSSHDGQTKKIMTAIADKLKSQMDYEMLNLKDLTYVNVNNYDVVCIGAAIRYGFFGMKLKEFVNVHSILFNQKKTAFFSVTLIARNEEKRTPETNSYTRKFLNAISWKPTMCETFAGALHYPEYNWLDRMMIKLIMRITGGETDTSKDIEYTDWEQVDAFAERFIEMAKSPNTGNGQKLYV
jgi:menaquinone-dependent protoporphyrinogen oxidase